MIRVEDYRPDHLARIRPRAIHEGDIPPQIKTRAIALIRDGEVLAIFGGAYVTPKVLHLWAFISDEVKKCARAFHNKTLELLAFLEKTESPGRIQMDVQVDFHEGIHWAESLGFKREGVMKHYGPHGEDCWLFARTVTDVRQ